ncbi:MAG TPA: protein kinase [Polyangiaceae bacterium]|nr:protein kinase [Polyangiaceae bacterium]
MTVGPGSMQGRLVLGRYRIVKQIARGGMGVVYLARTEGAQGFTRPVIVKRIISDLAEDEATARAFVREARILANLQHPGIVNVIDFNEERGAYVMVLEYVHGYNLGQWHKYVVDTRGKLPVEYAIYIVTRVLDALQYAHTFVRPDGTPMPIVHRDVSPGNILIDAQGHVKLLDFGIARADESDEYKTRDGMFKGKLSYSAPEVYDGVTSPRSDVYSAGVVLYQLLSGENPFRGKDMAEIVRRVLTYKLPPISGLRPDVSLALDAAVERAMAKNPQERYPSAAAFADALRSVRERPEDDFATEFIDDVWNDFNGDMAEKLKLEPLQARDAAWRGTLTGGEVPGTTSASLPAPRDSKATIVERNAFAETTQTATGAPAVSRTAWVAAGVAVLAAAAAAYAFTARKDEPTSRFVVVERQSTTEPSAPVTAIAPVPSAIPSAQPAVTASVPEPAPSEVPPPRSDVAPSTAGKADPASLSRKVQGHRGAIESCFTENVKEMDGRPEVSVHFRVNASGRVDAADLVPAALNATPLGQCLIGVARRIDFGALTESLSFTIPITARRVK